MPTKPLEPLTNKETDTWRLLAKGLMYKEIAHQQGVTIDTEKNTVKTFTGNCR